MRFSVWSEVDYNAFPDWSNTNDRSQAGLPDLPARYLVVEDEVQCVE